MSHGHCYLWEPGLVWLHVGSDSVIALAYFSIPVTLMVFIAKKRKTFIRSVVILFGLFICLCGFTHLFAVYNVWNGAYWLSGSVKAATAAVSLTTALFLIRSLPVALSIPFPDEYNKLASELGTESEGRVEAERRLRARMEVQTQQLWRSNSRWKLLTEFVYSVVWVTDTNGKVSQEMPSWEAFTGQTHAEYKEWGWLDAILPSDRVALAEHWKECVRDEQPYEFETHLWSEERNAYVPIITKGMPIRDQSGEVHEWLGAIYDLSAIKEQEVALASTSRRLEAKNKQLEEFNHVASHDLREPLRKVQAYGDLLEEDFAGDLPEEAVRYIGIMKSAANRMSGLLDEMLEYSKVSSVDLRIEKLDLNSLLRRVLEDLEMAVTEANAVVRLGELRTVDADASQLEHVFQNLLGNAIKYRSPERPVEIQVDFERLSSDELNQRCQVSIRGQGPWAVISVVDNGIGFDPQHADHILGAFKRLHGRSEYEGSGMGLAICNRIVERHNGLLKVDSVEGKGSTFRVILPVIDHADSIESRA
ncbi:ATP-binding protein [Pelagicoccus sp. SDUM812002]|uniref:sensor histidine kinase n=1 Tax=Pelagicoccus sp. SDUM812002 TaxID=3041266 RepID=UPI00280F1BDD|nr:ATP-binding protein [Pelagicoccus sp. SDUM812002]MDQ8187601.1 ATP-binding protein [Pelagicoccus sp. SDUM812002]